MTTRSLLFLAAGIIIGIIGTAIYCDYTREETFNEDLQLTSRGIDRDQAMRLRQNYAGTFRNDTIQGFNISVQELFAIDSTIKRTLNSDLSKTSGFRLYKGLATKDDPRSTKSFIVYPIDNTLRAQNPTRVFFTTGFDNKYVLPCPQFCD